MTTYFCETSAVIKLYHNEIGTDRMEGIFGDNRPGIIISELTTAEFCSEQENENRLTKNGFASDA